MGAKLGISKNLPISAKANGHEKVVPTIISKSSTLERRTKKKEKLSSKKSLDTMVDKYTSTDGGVVSSSAYIRHLVNGSGRNISVDSLNTPDNSRRPSEAPSKDIIEFRDACVRRGIISPEMKIVKLSNSTEEIHQIGTEKTVEESTTSEPPTPTVDTNDEQVPNEQTVETSEW